MSYLKKVDHVVLDSVLSGLEGVIVDRPEQLTYCIHKLVKRYLQSHKDISKKIDQAVYCSVIGAIEMAKLEIYKNRDENL